MSLMTTFLTSVVTGSVSLVVWIQCQSSPYVICIDRGTLGQICLQVLWFYLVSVIAAVLYTYLLIYHQHYTISLAIHCVIQ